MYDIFYIHTLHYTTLTATLYSTIGAVVWYTVEVEVTSPQAESVIDVTAQVRKAVAVEITLGKYGQD